MILFQYIWDRYGGGRWMGHGQPRETRRQRRARQAEAVKKLATTVRLTSYKTQACLSYFIISSPP